jgi:hypothetical protein
MGRRYAIVSSVIPRIIKTCCILFVLFSGSRSLRADLIVTPWMPIYKGVHRAVGTNCPPTTVTNNGVVFTDSSLQVVNCVRVDLSDPDVQLFTTPRASGWVANSRETLSLSISNFIRQYKVQIASDANFYCVNQGGGCSTDPSSEGLPSDVHGFLVSTGQVVSPIDSQRYASLMFTTNKEPMFYLNNRPGATNVPGIYTAVTGYYPVLTNGLNVWALYYSDFNAQYPDSFIHNYQPRTAFGISQDRRYLFMMTIDGRQPGQNGGGACNIGQYSNGALDADTAMWLLLFGAWDAINMDGGGSTAMYMADCAGEPIGLNHSSLLVGGRERIIGCHFGVYAKPLPNSISDIVVTPADTTATITFQTPVPTRMRIDYGPTPAYGNAFSNLHLLNNHVATLNGLSPGSTYYYLITCTSADSTFQSDCRFFTVNPGSTTPRTPLFDVTKSWKWYSNNLDGVTWQAPGYNDGSWSGPGPGLLYIENSALNQPKSTQIAPQSSFPVAPTYYFRTHFNFTPDPAGVTLYFTNYIDDGAVFYLNGTEIRRIRMTPAPAAITYSSSTDPVGTGPCGVNDATCADIFAISGTLASSLVNGDNVLAAEVHQSLPPSQGGSVDMVFGSALAYSFPQVQRPTLNVFREGDFTTLYWNGSGFTLQETDDPGGTWTDVPGPVTSSTYDVNVFDGIKFYRLRN